MTNTLAERAHYFSTACLHLKHGECRGTCKFCSRPCGCECHRSPAPAGRSTEDTMNSTYDPNDEPDPPTRSEADDDERNDETVDLGTEPNAEVGTTHDVPGDRH